MLQALSQKPKPLAWFFVMVLYTELALPLAGRAENGPVNTYRAAPAFKRAATVPKTITDVFPFARQRQLMPVKIVPERSVMFSRVVADRVSGGPGQPEMQAFTSVNSSNMVDLFSGDFSYNIPLLDVGGYPVNLAYRSGITMDQEASWVGLGWNINPGTIARNLRGIPDDFNGTDSIKKITSLKENKTVGATVGYNAELVGLPLNVGISLGLFHNNYKGWGAELGLNATLSASIPTKGTQTGGQGTGNDKVDTSSSSALNLSAGLSMKNNSQEGITIAPSFSVALAQADAKEKSTTDFSISLPYSSRAGLKGLQLSGGVQQYITDGKNQFGGNNSSMISFASPSYTPTITIPFTSTQYSLTFKIGAEYTTYHPNVYVSGYASVQKIADKDTLLALPAYGYLHYQDGARNRSSLLDFNREKELIYRQSPATPHIALPIYTYDAFSITGEGTGGMFRAYRGDIGFVHDHKMRTKDGSNALSIDLGTGNLAHVGADLNINRAYTQNGPWLSNNNIANTIAFRKDSGAFEAAYFRNPGEKSVNSRSFYESIGGDDLVTVNLYQSSRSSSSIQATSSLRRYDKNLKESIIDLKATDGYRKERDKRTQVISYLNAKEASVAGLSKYIENYHFNKFLPDDCSSSTDEVEETSERGWLASYYRNKNLSGAPFYLRVENIVNHDWHRGRIDIPVDSIPPQNVPYDNFSVRWNGRIKAPVSGTYYFKIPSDDGVLMWVNDSLVIDRWKTQTRENPAETQLKLIKDEFYTVRLEYFEEGRDANIQLLWKYGAGTTFNIIPTSVMYPSLQKDTFVNGNLTREKRLNKFRKPNHISEITVLNNDGRRYVYGIPVYNLKQHEATFAVDYKKGDRISGLAKFIPGVNNSTRNPSGKDRYYNSEEMPAYAHSFLLSGIVSPDYVDVTGNGISDDDPGDGIKFNYTKLSGIANPFKWRAPYTDTSVTYNEGLKTDTTDDKGNYVYGEKELWMLNSIVSKSMMATFVLDGTPRLDLNEMDESGRKISSPASRRLKEINLYNKADYIAKKGMNVRPIKTVHFEYSYELCKGVNKPLNDSGKLTLKKVWFTYNGNNKGKQNPYIFNYNAKNPTYNIKSYDRWGNYKDPLSNPGSLPTNVIDNAEYPYALQDGILANANAAAWSLDSIKLPSGGGIKVDFESDDYAYVQNKRAMQLFKLAGFGNDSIMTSSNLNKLYTDNAENLYVYVKLPAPVSNKMEAYYKYLADVKKLYFKLYVKMRGDLYGSGSEYVPCYADMENAGTFGLVNANTLWIQLDGISLKGDKSGDYSPLAKAAIQFIRLNLPSKAYPGSEVGDDLSIPNMVKSVSAMADNYINAFSSFDRTARNRGDGSEVDLNRTYIRLNNPDFKKYGGGHRVKRIRIYDNWNGMTQQKEAVYGQEYTYTTIKEINGVSSTISSGVATFEPGIGGEENPLRVPIEVVEKIAPLGPVTLGYSEEPLGESLFPSPSIGYSNVRVRSLNSKNKRSASGFEETSFYTAYDFPVFTDRTVLDPNNKKTFKPSLLNLLKINARHYLSLSQGFRVELNDMNGKIRRQASYAETDSINPVKYTENIYKLQARYRSANRLSNDAMVMKPDGTIDTSAIIGKDVELMVDMREQQSIANGYNVNINADMFTAGLTPPYFLIPALLNLAQREENLFRSAAILKVVNRFGILDSVIQVDKGSKISTKDLMYDSETGDAILTRTQNEFNDPIYNFNYPAHWAYDGMGMAYKNIDVQVNRIDIRNGKIVGGLPVADSVYFTGGDEIFVAGKQQIGNTAGCTIPFSSFPSYTKIWAIDTSILRGGQKSICFVDENGKPYNGFDVSLKIIRSGRRNMNASVGSVTTLYNPIARNASDIQLFIKFNDTTQVIAAGANAFSQLWKVEDLKKQVSEKFTSIGACPVGYAYSSTLNTCIKDTALIIIDTFKTCLMRATHPAFSACGTYIYSGFTSNNSYYRRTKIDSNAFWKNSYSPTACTVTPLLSYGTEQQRSSNNNSNISAKISYPDTLVSPQTNLLISYDGPMNRAGVWSCDSVPNQSWFGFTVALNIPHSGVYYMGMGADDAIRVTLDSTIIRIDTPIVNVEHFQIWHILPVYISKGLHKIKIEAQNYSGERGVGFEIYDNTLAQVKSATSYAGLNLIFSTKDLIGNTYATSYGCPVSFTQTTDSLSNPVCRKTAPPSIDTGISVFCKSMVTDTLVNPYVTGILGNWRSNKAYVYYDSRAESGAFTKTNIRTNGTFKTFAPYWNFVSRQLKATSDTTSWVWNSAITLFNTKGLEIENKDPLGRYNAGLYGYGKVMPTAVIQNGRFRESAFEGFEDYDYNTQECSTVCIPSRHFDFSTYKSKFSTTFRHTGKKSLRLNGSADQVALSFAAVPENLDSLPASLAFTYKTDACVAGGQSLKDVKASSSVLLPSFSPLRGKQMVISAWVKEEQPCSGTTYTNNHIRVLWGGSTDALFSPSGPIIEGWQRYEGVFDIPALATSLTISLEPVGSSVVYFDDIRVHPFNANMKSYVYNPVDLRLMAELDENNYASYYEYDDDGTLIRVKKDTQRGIKTIKETRSALIKQ